MRCRYYKELASSYLDRQLTPREAVKYRQHHERCLACRIYLAELNQVSLVLKSTLQPEAPSRLRREVMVLITDE
jgi:hypothetical protein